MQQSASDILDRLRSSAQAIGEASSSTPFGKGQGPFFGIDDLAGDIGSAIASGAKAAYDFGDKQVRDVWDVVSGDRDRRYNEEQAEKAREFQVWFEKNKHSLNAEGLAQADINPMLAPQFSSSAGGSSVLPQSHDYGNAARDMIGRAVGIATTLADVRNKDSQTAKNLAEADDIAGLHSSRKDLLRMQTLETQAQQWLANESEKEVRARVKKIAADMQLTETQELEVFARIDLLRQQAMTEKNLTTGTGLDLKAKEVHNKWLDSSAGKWDATTGQTIREWIRSIMPGGTIRPR